MLRDINQSRGAPARSMAPPVYRPAAAPTTLQPQTAERHFPAPVNHTAPGNYAPMVAQKGNTSNTLRLEPPVASAVLRSCAPTVTPPPVYRPSVTPKTVQPSSANVAATRPAGPPVYRPQPTKLVQPKIFRPHQKMAPAPPVYRPIQPRVARSITANPQQRIVNFAGKVGVPAKYAPNTPGSPCQAKKKTDNGTLSESGKYFIADNNPYELLSAKNALPPQPISIFDQSHDDFGNRWTPKVRFLTGAVSQNVDSREDEVMDQFNLLEKQLGYIYGKNDCQKFAALVSRIYVREVKIEQEDKNIGKGVNVTYKEAECGYHAAPIVATDGDDIVTLEANVADKDRQRPHFAIYEGVKGFVDEQEDTVKDWSILEKPNDTKLEGWQLWNGKDETVGSEQMRLSYMMTENLIYYGPQVKSPPKVKSGNCILFKRNPLPKPGRPHQETRKTRFFL